MAMKDRQKPAPRFHSDEAASEGREGGSVGRLNFSPSSAPWTSVGGVSVRVESVHGLLTEDLEEDILGLNSENAC